VDQVTVFIYPVKPKRDFPVQGNLYFPSYFTILLTLSVAYVHIFIDNEVNMKFLTVKGNGYNNIK